MDQKQRLGPIPNFLKIIGIIEPMEAASDMVQKIDTPTTILKDSSLNKIKAAIESRLAKRAPRIIPT